MLRLIAAHCPELTNLVRWLYEREPHLVTGGGDTLRSSTGTQQGCPLSNPLFALVMEYINKKLEIDGLKVKQFYWDDTTLVGTPEAVCKALQIIHSLTKDTGLHLKWSKCHLHGTPEVMERCKTLSKPGFPIGIVCHDSYDMIYLKAPVGCDEFVARWLKTKLSKLEGIIKAIALMPFKHEGFTLMKSCAAECRVMYLMRVIPPQQLMTFMEDFDKVLHRGFEELLGIKIEEKWWRLAQLPAKFGGMPLRSGLRTFGAQHLCSLAKSAKKVDRIVNGWDVVGIANSETGTWLKDSCEQSVDIEFWVNRLKEGKDAKAKYRVDGCNYNYSLSQLCELNEQKIVSKLMSIKERLHIEAHSGQTHEWITQLPLSFKKYNLKSLDWMTAARRRLRLNVFPSQKHCTFCKGGWCDVKGDHAIMCGGGASRNLRHNNVRNIIAKAARDVGFKTGLEHGGGLGDKRRPGDVIVYNWRDGRHLLIDVAVINPLCSTNVDSLISEGVGGAATAYGRGKVSLYHDLNFSKYEFLPFIIETTGGWSSAAYGFCEEIRRLRDSLSCQSKFNCPYTHSRKPLRSAISVELQRANSRMVLERTPLQENLIESDIAKCELAISKKKETAIESLRSLQLLPARIHKEIKMGSKKKTKKNKKGSRLDSTVLYTNKIPKSQKEDKAKEKYSAKKTENKRSQRSTVWKYKGTMQRGVNYSSDRPARKPPHKVEKDSVGTLEGVTMEVEMGERIRAHKSKSSKDTPTPLTSSSTWKLNSSEDSGKKKPEAIAINKTDERVRSSVLIVSSNSNDCKSREDTEKVHWEPPCGQNMTL